MMRDVLRRLLAGELTEEEAERELRRVQLGELGGLARIDTGRPSRRGLPEVVLAEGKAPGESARLVVRLASAQGQGLISRLGEDHWRALEAAAGEAGFEIRRYHASARVLAPAYTAPDGGGRVAMLTAGTSDVRVADEARMVVEACGHEARLRADVGVAGLHRLLGPLAELVAWDPDVVVVAAGMDGVLPGVVAGLVPQPVIGVPVSTGYGRGGAGEAALLTMLQSCATGLVTVNIDNGVGAGAAAVLIAARAGAARRPAGPSPAPPRSAPPGPGRGARTRGG
jgi:pyridinium-3,5-biscarboxylic acid mononucleotide synthase